MPHILLYFPEFVNKSAANRVAIAAYFAAYAGFVSAFHNVILHLTSGVIELRKSVNYTRLKTGKGRYGYGIFTTHFNVVDRNRISDRRPDKKVFQTDMVSKKTHR
jgi:hypothetical protein